VGDPQSAYRKLERGTNLDTLFCFKYKRCMARDNTVMFFGRTIQIGPGPGGRSYAGCWVDVQERFDGSLWVYHQDRCLAKTSPAPIPPLRVRVRYPNGRYTEECPWTAPRESKTPREGATAAAQRKQKEPCKPAPNHPWRRKWVTDSQSNDTKELT